MINFQSIQDVFLTAVQVLFLTGVFWLILRVLRHTRGIFTLLAIITLCGIVTILNSCFNLPIFASLANGFLHLLPLLVIILFQEDIRRFLTHPALLLRRVMARTHSRKRQADRQKALAEGIDELLKAVCCLTQLPEWRNYLVEYFHMDLPAERLASGNTGALIAIKGIAGLREIEEAGIPLDCQMEYHLLRTIFYPGSPLHDGGVVLRPTGDGLRITAAGCYFPQGTYQAEKPAHARQNAMLGLAERTDAFVLMISEETGKVLMTEKREMETTRRLNTPMELRRELEKFFQTQEELIREDDGAAEVHEK